MWMESIDNFKVIKKEIPRPSNKPYYNVEKGIVVLHTTEGDTIDGAFNALNKSHSAPHFIIGQDKIYQNRPIGVQGAALKSNDKLNPNKFAEIQIEIVGRSKQELWMPEEGTLNRLLAILRYCKDELKIPMVVPVDGWEDNLSDLKGTILATESNRRRKDAWNFKFFPERKGVWMHLEIPFNNHWDCGALRRSEILSLV